MQGIREEGILGKRQNMNQSQGRTEMQANGEEDLGEVRLGA